MPVAVVSPVSEALICLQPRELTYTWKALDPGSMKRAAQAMPLPEAG
jgi:hypothetical protein